MEKEDFDIVTKQSSPSKNSLRFSKNQNKHAKFDPSELIPEGYEDHLMREELLATRNRDPFKMLGVSNEDKMTFFLLKWVFNAIKRDSDSGDVLEGKAYVQK